MAVQKFLEELSVQQLVNKYNFIVPEIQREYVWGNNDHNILDKFFYDIKESIRENTTNEEDTLQIRSLEKMLERADDKDKENIKKLVDTYLVKKELNIGFLYSYRPYYNYNDTTNDVFLIDGQQRLTTLFLALFYFALKENNYDDFIALFRFDEKLEKIAFDYRVRTLTHNFLIELITNCKTLEDLINIKQKRWFLADFAEDVTIRALLGAISKLQENFIDDGTEYYQFIKKQIRFWHFKTEETSQGEELYITMNSRGQQLADNETVRAKLFENDRVKAQQIEFGAKWEVWQDFFWKNKPGGGNADNGLNLFLRWVNIIECFSTKTFKSREVSEKEYKKLLSENLVLEYVSLFEIEPYFNALQQLKSLFDEGFFNLSYFKNNFSGEWLKGDVAQIHLMKLFPALMFLKANNPKEQLNRFIRFFSNVTSDIDIAKNPDNYIIEAIQLTKLFLEKGYTDAADLITFKGQFGRILSNEEVFKLQVYKRQADVQKRIKTEELFWRAEDFKFSRGRIGHLLQATLYKGEKNRFEYTSLFDYNLVIDIDIDEFSNLFSIYSQFINAEDEIWGELLITKVYLQEPDRVSLASTWFLNSGFFNLIFEKREKPFHKLTDFLIEREKLFITSTYNNEDELEDEQDSKKQLYIYYILHKRILDEWDWSKWNFGIYQGGDYPSVNSLFNNNYIYQRYKLQWRYNIGYVEKDGIWVQNHLYTKRYYTSQIINWSK